MAYIQVQVQTSDTSRVFFTPQPDSYAELHDAIKIEIPKALSVNFRLLFINGEIKTQRYKHI